MALQSKHIGWLSLSHARYWNLFDLHRRSSNCIWLHVSILSWTVSENVLNECSQRQLNTAGPLNFCWSCNLCVLRSVEYRSSWSPHVSVVHFFSTPSVQHILFFCFVNWNGRFPAKPPGYPNVLQDWGIMLKYQDVVYFTLYGDKLLGIRWGRKTKGHRKGGSFEIYSGRIEEKCILQYSKKTDKLIHVTEMSQLAPMLSKGHLKISEYSPCEKRKYIQGNLHFGTVAFTDGVSILFCRR